MKNLFLLASICVLGFASCKSSTCPAYSQKSDRSVEQKAMVKAVAKAPVTSKVNG
ncbi:hypothetical protein ACD591_20325 [Rufibacter glacialis]|uniref:Uncharacterized protein n=1 Tax=Rufibacter glacialis TaxID=1259555 RepID=A0ABV4RKH9_9BACT|nr:hypothetical protein [Rufibacter glacialis]